MKQADVIKLAHEACGVYPREEFGPIGYLFTDKQLERFAALVLASQPERSALEQFDLEQLPGYHEGRKDGRILGYEVGTRHATERFASQPVQVPGWQPKASALLVCNNCGKWRESCGCVIGGEHV